MKYLDIKWIKEHYTLTVATEGIIDEVYDRRVSNMLQRDQILEDITDMIDYACSDYLTESSFDMDVLVTFQKRIETLRTAYTELWEAFYG